MSVPELLCGIDLFYILALPMDSNGRAKLRKPAAMYRLADTNTGTDVKPTYVAMIGAIKPQIRLNAAAIPLPVPRCTEGRTSGV